MLRKITVLLIMFFLATSTVAEAGSGFELRVFSGLRFGGAFIDGGYEDNPILEELDVKPGVQFGGSFYIPIGTATSSGQATKFELLVNFQKSDLRFKPASISGVPDSIKTKFVEDGDKLILGEIKVTYIHAGAMYQFGSSSGWNPHVNMGLGATIFKATDGDLDEKKFSFSLGAGISRMFGKTVGSRLQLRGYFTSLPAESYWVDSYGNVWASRDNNMFFQGEISTGLVFAF